MLENSSSPFLWLCNFLHTLPCLTDPVCPGAALDNHTHFYIWNIKHVNYVLLWSRGRYNVTLFYKATVFLHKGTNWCMCVVLTERHDGLSKFSLLYCNTSVFVTCHSCKWKLHVVKSICLHQPIQPEWVNSLSTCRYPTEVSLPAADYTIFEDRWN